MEADKVPNSSPLGVGMLCRTCHALTCALLHALLQALKVPQHEHPLTVKSVQYHSCNICRASISGDCYRCDRCDFDLCIPNCYPKYKPVTAGSEDLLASFKRFRIEDAYDFLEHQLRAVKMDAKEGNVVVNTIKDWVALERVRFRLLAAVEPHSTRVSFAVCATARCEGRGGGT